MSPAVDAGLDFFRGQQADQFSQTATIRRPTGELVTNPATGLVTQPVATVATGARCKVTSGERVGQDIDVAETEATLVDHLVKFKVGTDVEKDDLIEITGSRYDAADIGRIYRVTSIDRREWQIARRCVVEEVLVPMDWSDA